MQADDGRKRFDNWQYDVEADIPRYAELSARLQPFIADTVSDLNDAYDAHKRILIEGANATLLDLDVGTYPFVTSSNTSVGGVAAGSGLAPTKFEAIIGVVSRDAYLDCWCLSCHGHHCMPCPGLTC